MNNSDNQNLVDGIAVIGLAGRFPGARNIDEFWQNLATGRETISLFSDEELLASGVSPALLADPNYVKARGILGDADLFDAAFFGFSPKVAELMDPQHRLFLECAWEALEDAGYDSERYAGRIGVYAGESMNTYLLVNLYSHLNLVASAEGLQAAIGNDKDSLTTEASYRLNLRGPGVTVQTSSSTSLSAVHVACQSVLNYECDMALAGGVSIHFPEKAGYLHHDGGPTSLDGHCRAFDAQAQGFVSGHGAGIVVLKRLADALADGDRIYAVIRGSAMNNDGSLKVSYMAPSVEGQVEVVALAQALAGVEAETISYVEAHGTATALGDPIEVAALTKAFRANTDKRNFCAIGSVKTNIGHLDSAAGVAGLIKTVLALHHKQIPASLHFERPNPQIDFDNSPFYVNTQLTDWKTNGHPRRAGVTSLGMGGTNAHAILEEAPMVEGAGPSRPWQVLLLSAKSTAALDNATVNLAQHLRQRPELNLADMAYTLQVGRRAFTYRRVVVCQAAEDAATALEGSDPQHVFSERQEARQRPVAFLLSGQGTQYPNMSQGLYETEPLFREQVDRCAELLKPHLGRDIRELLYPNPVEPSFPRRRASSAQDLDARLRGNDSSTPTEDAEAEPLTQTANAQVALFVVEYALAQLWQSWGLKPVALLGHSLGEYVAACLAGVFSLEDGLKLVAARGRLMQSVEPGAMLSVTLSEIEVQKYLKGGLDLDEPPLRLRAAHPERSEAQSKETPRSAQGAGLWLAAVNAPGLTVLSGTFEAIDQLEQQLTAEGIGYRRLVTSHAFHSGMMEGIVGEFVKVAKTIKLNAPQIPYISNISGTWITADEAMSADYWGRHIRAAVRFGDGVAELLKEPDLVLLEVGPGRVLSTLSKQSEGGSARTVLTSLRSVQESEADEEYLLRMVGKLWLAGVEIDWPGFYAGERRQRVSVPTYPFERQRYWIEPLKESASRRPVEQSGKRTDIADWFYLPSWKQTLPLPSVALESLRAEPRCWVVFMDDAGLGAALTQRLGEAQQDVIQVMAGEKFSSLGAEVYCLNPRQAEDYRALLADLRAQGKTPNVIAHFWSVTSPKESARPLAGDFEQAQFLGFYSLLYLAQALGEQRWDGAIQIEIISNQLQSLSGEEPVSPAKATILGPAKVIPQEYPNIICRSIDVALPASNGWRIERLISQLLAELSAKPSDLMVAYRGAQRWTQTFEAVRIEKPSVPLPCLRDGGVYLITGGLGGIGLVLAEHLAKTMRAKLILVGRSVLPAREEWSQWLEAHTEPDDVSRKIKKVQALEALGAEVLLLNADVAQLEQMQSVIAQILKRFGGLQGVIHAAGVVREKSFRAIQEIGVEECAVHFAPKVDGARVLEEVLRDQALDFCLLFSSLSSVLGGLGSAAYAAANLFIDSLAHEHNRTHPTAWTSVNWDAWRLEAELGQSLSATLAELAITPEEGAQALERILSLNPVAQIIVSTGDLQGRMNEWVTLESLHAPISASSAEPALLHPRPNLQNPYVAPRTEIERTLAQIWQTTLGIQPVGIHDNFFELGGSSLSGIQVIAQLKKEFNVPIPTVSLYEGPTVSALAKIINPDQEGAEAAYDDNRSRGERRRDKKRKRLSDQDPKGL